MPYKKVIYKRFFLLFLSIVTVYTSILAVMLVIRQRQLIQQNNEYLNEFYVVQTASNIDNKVSIALQSAQAIAYKDSVADYRSDSTNDYLKTMKVYDDIRSTLNPIQSLEFEIGLTKGEGDFITSNGYFSGGGVYLEFIGLDTEYFENLDNIFADMNSRIYVVPETFTTIVGNTTIIYRFKSPSQEKDLFMFITFRKHRLISMEPPNGMGTFHVYSSDMQSSFASSAGSGQLIENIKQMHFKTEMANHAVERGENKEFIAYRTHSDVLPVEYVYLINRADLEQLNFEQLQVVTSILVVLALGGGIIIYIATKKSYSPIQEMLNKIPETYETITTPENELEFIVSTVRRTNEDNIRLLDKQKYHYSLEAERGLVQSIRDCDCESMHIILADILSTNLKTETLDEYSISCFKYALLSTVKRILRSHNQSVLHFVERNQSAFQNLTVKNDSEKLCNAFESIFASLACDCIEEDTMTYNSPTTTKILNYIHEHYLEELSLTVISEHFGLTEGYISKLLRETANIKFKTYLNHLKIKKAKELLQTGNYKITEVSNMVGYNNVNSFIRMFKKEEGISPGNYKKMDD